MLKVACIKWGDKYGAEYVNILSRAVADHLSLPHQFVCYTDKVDGVECLTRPLPPGFEGWWNKLYLFSLNRRVLLLDLDIVVVGSLDELVVQDFRAVKDQWQKGYNSSAVHIMPGMTHVWDQFLIHRPDKKLHGDQDWLNIVPGFKDEFCYDRGMCASYKAEVKGRGLPKNCSVVYFHGEPKPHEVNDKFVTENWHQRKGPAIC